MQFSLSFTVIFTAWLGLYGPKELFAVNVSPSLYNLKLVEQEERGEKREERPQAVRKKSIDEVCPHTE